MKAAGRAVLYSYIGPSVGGVTERHLSTAVVVRRHQIVATAENVKSYVGLGVMPG